MDRFVYRQKIKRTLSFLRERWHMKSFAGSGIATFQHLPLGSETQIKTNKLYISCTFYYPFTSKRLIGGDRDYQKKLKIL